MALRIQGLHHDHIDGSRAVLDVLQDLYTIADVSALRFTTPQCLITYFDDVHEDLVGKFVAVTGLLQSEESLRLLGFAYGHRRWSEGMRYVEAKFAPQYHVFGGLSLRKATEAMCDGLWRAQRRFGIRILPQLCIGREAEPELGMEIAKLALDYDGAVALDLACDEAGYLPERHLPAYRLTWGSKVKRDCHAGEWVASEPADDYRARLLKNVRTAVHVLKCDGIGHAIPLADDPELVKIMVDRRIRVAMCPGSNIATGKIKGVKELRMDELLAAGLAVTINPDDDLFLPTMDETVAACERAYDFAPHHAQALEQNVFRHAFASDVRDP